LIIDADRKSLFQLDVETFSSLQGLNWEESPTIIGNKPHWHGLLKKDANSLYINALLTLLDALYGIHNKAWTWSTVKLYYVLFYIFKVELYLDGIGLFRKVLDRGSALYVIDLRESLCRFNKGSGRNVNSDHYRILNVHKSVYFDSDPIYSQTIDGDSFPVWMRDQREIANYKQIKFEDPTRNDLYVDFNFDLLGEFELSNQNIYLDSAAMAAIPITKCIQVRKKMSDLIILDDTKELILHFFNIAIVPQNIQDALLGTTVSE